MMHFFARVSDRLIEHIGLFELAQFFLFAATLSIAFLRPGLGNTVFTSFERRIRIIAARPILSLSVIAAVALLSRGLLLPLMGRSDPTAPDELSIILQAQTYLTGHLSNSVKLSPDFTSIYVFTHPTYASMYPVLRSAPLFVGSLIGIGFAGGVWLCVIALCLLTYWTLCAFVPRSYALVAALIVVARFAVFSWWVNSYFGPALTAVGGLLLIGGYARIVKQPRVIYGCAIGVGVFLMMTTRPFEGLVISAPFACALLVRFIRTEPRRRPALMAAGAAAAAFVIGGVGLTVLHNRAVTGDPRTAPYSLYREQVATMAPFLFQEPRLHPAPDYMQERSFISLERQFYDHSRTTKGLLVGEASRFLTYISFYVGFALLIPFLVGGWTLRRRPLILVTAILFCVCLAIEAWSWSQYASPAFGLFILAIAMGLQSLRTWRIGERPVGLALSRWLPLGLLVGLSLPLSYLVFGTPGFPQGKLANFQSSCCWLHPRSLHGAIDRTLDRLGTKNIVVVDEGARAPPFGLLVYNDADIAHSKTIWLNADPRYNQATFERYPDRIRWRLDWRDDGSACLTRLDADTQSTTKVSQPCFGHFGTLTNAFTGLLETEPAFHG